MKKIFKILFIVFVIIPAGCCMAWNMLVGGSLTPSEPQPEFIIIEELGEN